MIPKGNSLGKAGVCSAVCCGPPSGTELNWPRSAGPVRPPAIRLGWEAGGGWRTTGQSPAESRVRRSATIARMSKPCDRAYASRTARTSRSTSSSTIALTLRRQLLRCANQRRLVPGCPAHRLYLRTQRHVGDMSAIPRQQVLHSMDSRCGDVKRVRRGLFRQRHAAHQRFRQLRYLSLLLQEKEAPQGSQPIRSGLRIARLAFLHNQTRQIQVEPVPTRPPLAGDLLMRRPYQVSAWPSCQVAGDRRLDVNGRLHLVDHTPLPHVPLGIDKHRQGDRQRGNGASESVRLRARHG